MDLGKQTYTQDLYKQNPRMVEDFLKKAISQEYGSGEIAKILARLKLADAKKVIKDDEIYKILLKIRTLPAFIKERDYVSERRAEMWAKKFIQAAQHHKVAIDSVLDVGCGTGDILCETVKQLGLQKEAMTCIDVKTPVKCPQAVYVNGDQFSSYQTLETGKFNAVFCSMVLHHISWWQKVLPEIHRVLIPSGLLMVREHNFNPKDPLMEKYLNWIHGVYMVLLDADPKTIKKYTYNYFSYQSLHQSLTKLGFKQLKIDFKKFDPERQYFAIYQKASKKL